MACLVSQVGLWLGLVLGLSLHGLFGEPRRVLGNLQHYLQPGLGSGFGLGSSKLA